MYSHQAVLLNEAIAGLNLDQTSQSQEAVIIDGTFGRGGHSAEILKRLPEHAHLLAFDKDPAALQEAERRFGNDSRFSIVHDSFANLDKVVIERGWQNQVFGILLDLGVSSPQLEDGNRGFSFLHDGPLDMRMDPTQGESAADWLAQVAEKKLTEVLLKYGEERYARRIARAIIAERQKTAITSTAQLAEIVKAAHPRWPAHKHPATQTFQGIRIHINNELADIEQVLQASLSVLAPGGRLAVISFHSLEDRIVKSFIKQEALGDPFPSQVPVQTWQLNPRLKIVQKAIKPSTLEVEANVRARSAVLRVAERLP